MIDYFQGSKLRKVHFTLTEVQVQVYIRLNLQMFTHIIKKKVICALARASKIFSSDNSENYKYTNIWYTLSIYLHSYNFQPLKQFTILRQHSSFFAFTCFTIPLYRTVFISFQSNQLCSLKLSPSFFPAFRSPHLAARITLRLFMPSDTFQNHASFCYAVMACETFSFQ